MPQVANVYEDRKTRRQRVGNLCKSRKSAREWAWANTNRHTRCVYRIVVRPKPNARYTHERWLNVYETSFAPHVCGVYQETRDQAMINSRTMIEAHNGNARVLYRVRVRMKARTT